ncbi:YwqG family protein [Streptomyces sp. NPDC001868]|uniref:YwqG family protein n=1 Tax=Streptomyces sp. NPDC001868 TaxID=3154401 RepID=UPI00331D9774
MTDDRHAPYVRDLYSRLAVDLLPAELAERWTALVRPCARLRRAAEGEPVAATLGGEPELPAGADWPEHPGHGPLSFVASVRCAALPREGLGEGFPPDGTLLFFAVDFSVDSSVDSSVGSSFEGRGGAHVLYVPAGTPTFPVAAPQELTPSPRTDLTAPPEESAPDLWLPRARQALLGEGELWPHPRRIPSELRPFHRAFGRLRTRVGHQIGGHALPVQGPVEYEIAGAELGEGLPWGDPLLDREAERWVLLAQFDGAGDGAGELSWGGAGTLYWFIRPEDLTAHRFGGARLVVQC